MAWLLVVLAQRCWLVVRADGAAQGQPGVFTAVCMPGRAMVRDYHEERRHDRERQEALLRRLQARETLLGSHDDADAAADALARGLGAIVSEFPETEAAAEAAAVEAGAVPAAAAASFPFSFRPLQPPDPFSS